MGRPVLFLDLDGVICCNFRGELEYDKLCQVKRICDQTEAVVVLSTDWRRRSDLRQRAYHTLESVGVNVVGSTPEYSLMARVRPLEILAWMKENRFDPQEGWCAIDDRDLVLEEGGRPAFIGHFVLTEFMIGLTPLLADQCIQKLRSTRQSAQPPPGRPPSVCKESQELSSAPSAMTGPAPAMAPASSLIPSTRCNGTTSSSPGSFPSESDGGNPLCSLRELLRDSSLEHLEAAMSGVSLRSLDAILNRTDGSGGRVALLAHLKGAGLSKIGERQALANAFSKAQRLGRIAIPPPADEPTSAIETPSLAAAPHPSPSRSPLSSPQAAHLVGFAYAGSSMTSFHGAPAASQPASADGFAPSSRSHPKDEQLVKIYAPGSELALTTGLIALQPSATRVCIILHPHPARGGDMHSPFVVQCVQLCRRHGISTLRFDFSVPDGWHLREATDELLHANSRELASAIAMLRLRAPAAHVILAGYSWGALVGLAVARQEPSSVQALALIAPPIDFVPEALGPSRRDFALWPMLLACGETDEYCSAERLKSVASTNASTTVIFKGVGHFLQGESAATAASYTINWVSALHLSFD